MFELNRGCWSALAALAILVPATLAAMPSDPRLIASLDLSKPFGLAPGWRFTATQGPAIVDPIMEDGGKVPGAIRLCLKNRDANSCSPDLLGEMRVGSERDLFTEPHYLNRAQIVYPRGAPGQPLLLVQTASLQSVDGDQRVLTQLLAARPNRMGMRRVFEYSTGRNNNQEVRYIAAGALRGSVITVEPTGNAPFNFWVTVNALTPGYAYRQTLHYRSATHYGDGNPLAVIDSEMPNILNRLGHWQAGMPLPLPATPCPKPHLVKTALWCR